VQKQIWLVLIVLGAIVTFIGSFGYGQTLLWFGAAILVAGVLGALATRFSGRRG